MGVTYTVTDPNNPGNTYNTATEGLRNLTGRVNADGTVSLFAVTSTISAAPDQGADPNQLVAIADLLANTSPSVAAKLASSSI